MVKDQNKIIILNILSSAIVTGIGFISAPLFSRLLGTSDYGLVQVYNTWVTLAGVIFTLQAGAALGNARISFKREEQEAFQASSLGLILTSYSICSFFTLIISIIFKLNLFIVLLGLIQGLGAYCVSFIGTKFTFEFEAKKNFILAVVIAFMNVGLSLFFMTIMDKSENYMGRIYGASVTYLVGFIFVIIYVFQRNHTFFNHHYWMFTVSITTPIIFHNLAYTVLNQSDRIMLQRMIDNSTVGIYTLAYSFSSVLTVIYSALNTSWVPSYYELAKKGNYDYINKRSKNYIELYTITCCGFMLLSREVYHIFASEEYWDGTDYLIPLVIGCYMVFLYSFPVNHEIYNKRTKMVAVGTVGAAIVNILLNYSLIKSMGAIGAVLATTISNGCQFLFHYMVAIRIKDTIFPYKMKTFIPGILIVFLFAAFSEVFKPYMIIRFAVAVTLSVFILTRMIKRRAIF